MARTVGLFSERFFESQRLSMTIEAFDEVGKRTPTREKGIEQDLLDLSPLANLGSIIDRFKRSAGEGATAEISVAAPEGDFSYESGDPRLERDLDFILRLMARDEKDLSRLRQQFKDLFALARGEAPPQVPGLQVSAGTPSESSSASPATIAASSTPSGVGGLRIDGRVRVETAAMRELRVTLEKTQGGLDVKGVKIKQIDPLVLDLDQNGFDLVAAGEGGRFDIDADGAEDRTGWVKGQDALLVMDRNGNGRIDDGRELFGDQNGAAHGFAELAKLDQNGDARIDKKDAMFKALKLYRDLDGDGRIQRQELSTLDDLGIASLNLRFVRDRQKINGNALLLQATFERTDGSTGKIGDFLFGYQSGVPTRK